MKTRLILLFSALFFQSGFSQNMRPSNPENPFGPLSFGLYKNDQTTKVGLDFYLMEHDEDYNQNAFIGIGTSIDFNQNIEGIPLKQNNTENKVVNSYLKDFIGIYSIYGYKYNSVKANIKLGTCINKEINYYTSYDSSKIYYNIDSYKETFLIGLNVGYRVNDIFYLECGYDTFNKLTFGFSISPK